LGRELEKNSYRCAYDIVLFTNLFDYYKLVWNEVKGDYHLCRMQDNDDIVRK